MIDSYTYKSCISVARIDSTAKLYILPPKCHTEEQLICSYFPVSTSGYFEERAINFLCARNKQSQGYIWKYKFPQTILL